MCVSHLVTEITVCLLSLYVTIFNVIKSFCIDEKVVHFQPTIPLFAPAKNQRSKRQL